MKARAYAWAALSLLGCKVDLVRERDKASDAGYEYRPGLEVGNSRTDAAAAPMQKPSIELVAGRPGGRGDLDGATEQARLGLVAGMVRVGDSIVFADQGNGALKRFTPATGMVETLIHLPTDGRPSLPAYVAYDRKQSRVFVTDRSQHVVYQYSLTDKRLMRLAGTAGVRGEADGALATSTFDAPTGIAFDGERTLFVADTGGRRVRALDLETQTVKTLAKNLMQVWGICFDGKSLFAADNLRESVLSIDSKSGEVTLVAGSNRFGFSGVKDGPPKTSGFREPRGVDCANGSVFVAERGNSTLRRVTNKEVSTIAGVSTFVGHRDGYAKHALFADLQSVLVWDENTLYVGDEASIRVVASDAVKTVAGMGSLAPVPVHAEEEHVIASVFPTPEGIWTSAGSAFVTNCADNTVKQIDLKTNVVTGFVGEPRRRGFRDGSYLDAQFNCPAAVAGDNRGNLFVADRANHAIRAINIEQRRVETIAGTPSHCRADDGSFETATFCDPSGLAFDGRSLFVVDAAASVVRRVDLFSRTVTTVAGVAFEHGYADGPAQAARFNRPSSVAYRDGVLLVADTENHVVRQVDLASGVVSTLVGVAHMAGDEDGDRASTRLTAPSLVSPAPEGFFIVDRHALRLLSAGTMRTSKIASAGLGLRIGTEAPSFSRPAAFATLSPGVALVVDRNENVVVKLLY